MTKDIRSQISYQPGGGQFKKSGISGESMRSGLHSIHSGHLRDQSPMRSQLMNS